MKRGKNMDWSINEMLFYGGIICAAAAAVGEFLCLCIFKMKKNRLEIQLDKEYGDDKK